MVVLCGAIVFLCGYIGYLFSSRLKDHAEYFKEMVNLCSKLSLNLSFLQNKLPVVLETSITNHKGDYAKTISSFCEKLNTGVNCGVFLPEYITDNERKTIETFLHGLGKNDAETEQQNVCNYKAVFQNCFEQANTKYAKNGRSIIKISGCVGLAIAILIF
ncbi:MAG: stage III sporulation protein AB [Clostridia bacterium]|nr:stage III sporulation protein AB [Clostridia bacterium]